MSGDMKHEKLWPAIQKDAKGIIFVYDPKFKGVEDHLSMLVS